MIRHSLKWIWYCAVTVLVCFALFMTALRAVTPELSHKRHYFQNLASTLLHRPVQIGQVHATVDGFTPELIFDDVKLLSTDKQKNILNINHVAVRFNLFQSLLQRQVQPRTVIVDGAELIVQHHPDGTWHVAGIDQAADLEKSENNPFLTWLLTHHALILKRFTMHVMTSDKRSLTLGQVNISLVNQGDQHRFHGQLQLQEASKTQIELIGDLHGGSQWNGILFLQTNHIQIEQWLSELPWKSLPVKSGTVAGRFWLQFKNSHLDQIRTQATLQNLKIEATQNDQIHPIFIHHAAADMDWHQTDKGANIKINSHRLQVIVPELTATPLNISEIRGYFDFNHQNNDWQVHGHSIYFNYADRVNSSGEFVWQKNADHPSGFLELTADAGIKNASTLIQQLPALKLNPRLLSWLQSSLTNEGTISSKVAIKGELNQFPYADNQGLFDLSLKVNDVALHFHPEWPTLTHTVGKVLIHNNHLFADIQQGQLGTIPIDKSHIEMKDLLTHHKNLEIEVHSHALFQNVLTSLRNTPLQDALVPLQPLHPNGLIEVKSNIFIPLHQPLPVKVTGDLDLLNDTLQIPKFGLIQQLRGAVTFTESTLQATDLTGQWQKQAVHAKLATIFPNTSKAATEVTVQTHIKPNTLLDWKLLQQVTGITSLFVNVKIPHELTDPINVHVQSNLKGIQTNLPEPLNKASQDVWPLDVTATIGQLGHQGQNIQAAIKGRVSTILQANETMQRGAIEFGGGIAHLPSRSGLSINGHLTQLSIDEWRNQLSSGQQMSGLPIQAVDLQIDHLVAFQQHWPNMHLAITQESPFWLLKINSPIMKGWVQSDLKGIAPVKAHFTSVHLPEPNGKGHSVVDSLTVDPRNLPPIVVHIDDFRADHKHFGALELKASKVPKGLRIDSLQLKADPFELNATGDWLQQGSASTSKLEGEAKSVVLSDTLKMWGIEPAVEAKQGYYQFAFAWPKPIYLASITDLSGHLHMQLKDGRITHLNDETEKKLGIGKLLSILSLQSLPKRLTLNFGDLNEAGFPYSSFTGDFDFQHGQAQTKNAVMDGPVAYVSVDGLIGFAQKNYRLKVQVSPHVEATLPVVATIAGGPVVGAATWVATHIMSNQLRAVNHYDYALNGAWSAPSVQTHSAVTSLAERAKHPQYSKIHLAAR